MGAGGFEAAGEAEGAVGGVVELRAREAAGAPGAAGDDHKAVGERCCGVAVAAGAGLPAGVKMPAWAGGASVAARMAASGTASIARRDGRGRPVVRDGQRDGAPDSEICGLHHRSICVSMASPLVPLPRCRDPRTHAGLLVIE